jgi:hypothetical protein
LVLGRSEKNTLALQAALNATLAPFRAISLLQTQSTDDEMLVKSHCFRVGPGDDWISAVEALCKFLPIVVLDLRDSTTYVEEEIRIVLQKGYLFKTVLVTPEARREPILARAHDLHVEPAEAEVVCVGDDAQCIELLRSVLSVQQTAPTQTRPLGSFSVRS